MELNSPKKVTRHCYLTSFHRLVTYMRTLPTMVIKIMPLKAQFTYHLPEAFWYMAEINLQDFTLLITYCTSTCAQRLYNKSFSLISFLKEGAWSCLSLVSSTTLYIVTIWYIWRLAMNTKSWGAQPGRNKTNAQEMQLILNTDTSVLIRWVDTRVKVTPGRPTWTLESLRKENSREIWGTMMRSVWSCSVGSGHEHSRPIRFTSRNH